MIADRTTAAAASSYALEVHNLSNTTSEGEVAALVASLVADLTSRLSLRAWPAGEVQAAAGGEVVSVLQPGRGALECEDLLPDALTGRGSNQAL